GVVFCAFGRSDRGCVCGRLIGAGDGLCSRSYLGRPFQPCCHVWVDCGRTFPSRKCEWLYHRSSYWRRRRFRGVLNYSFPCAAAGVFYMILSGAAAAKWNDFIAISNLYGGQHNFSLAAVALTETIMTALFLIVIANVITADRPVGFAPLAIGLALTMIHLVAIPISNASVNPARSTATAIFGGGVALSCLWLFWIAPIVGGVIGGLIARWLQTVPASR